MRSNGKIEWHSGSCALNLIETLDKGVFIMAWMYTISKATGKVIEAEQYFDRDVHLEPRKPRGKGNKMKMSGSAERHRRPTHRSGKVISYRVVI